MRVRERSPLRQRVSLLFVLVAAALNLVGADIYHYNDLKVGPNKLIYRESGMFSHDDAPAKSAPGHGDSFIKLSDLAFRKYMDRSCGYIGSGWDEPWYYDDDFPYYASSSSSSSDPCTARATLQVVIFNYRDFASLGHMDSEGTPHYCCGVEEVGARGCEAKDMGRLIVKDPSILLHDRSIEVSRDPGLESTFYDAEDGLYEVAETGMYVVLLANCDPAVSIVVNGHTEWMNPYGYLPGELYGALPFFLTLSLLYIVLAAVWMALCFQNTKDLLPMQMWISAVLILGMVETSTKYFDYKEWNSAGERGYGVMVFGLLAGVAKRALSRVMVLMVCMGYGIVRPSLGKDLGKVLALGVGYFVAALSYDLLANTPHGDEFTGDPTYLDTVTMLTFVVSVLDVIFFLWIMQSIFGVLAHLQQRQHQVKLTLYSRFRVLLIIAGLFYVAWSLFGIVHYTNHRSETDWQLDWAVLGVWEVLSLFVLAGTCLLLRPSVNAQRYAYHAKDDGEDAPYSGQVEMSELMGNGGGDDDDDDAEYGGRSHGVGDEDDFILGDRSALSHPVSGKKAKD